MGTPLSKKGAQPPPIFGLCLLWSNGCMDQDATWYGGRPRPRRQCVRWDPAPSPKGGKAPSQIFCSCLLWPRSWLDQGGTWHGGETWSRPHCARWRPSSPIQKGDSAPIFGPFLLWMKTPLGTEVDLGPGHFVLDGFQGIRERGTTAPPSFRHTSIVATVAHLDYC